MPPVSAFSAPLPLYHTHFHEILEMVMDRRRSLSHNFRDLLLRARVLPYDIHDFLLFGRQTLLYLIISRRIIEFEDAVGYRNNQSFLHQVLKMISQAAFGEFQLSHYAAEMPARIFHDKIDDPTSVHVEQFLLHYHMGHSLYL